MKSITSLVCLATSLIVVPQSVAFAAGTTETIASAAKHAFGKPMYAPALVSIALMDAKSGEMLFESNSSKSVLPASCHKVITTLAAMHYLGPGSRFETTLNVRGKLNAKCLVGDLIVLGSGDPTFGSSRVPDSATSVTIFQQWTQAVRDTGITTITGHVRVDPTWFHGNSLPATWEWEDIGNYYGAAASGFNFRDNFFDLVLQPGNAVGDPAAIVRTEPIDAVQVGWDSDLITSAPGSGDQAYIYSAPHSTRYRLNGSIPIGPQLHVKAALHDPALLFVRLLSQHLASAGIAILDQDVAQDAPTTRIATIHSPPLLEIVRVIHKQSFNLYAESLLLWIGNGDGKDTRARGLKLVRDYLESLGVPLQGVHLADACGLSRGNGVTSGMFASLLFKVQSEPWFGLWHDSLAVMGVDGDLHNRSKNTVLAGRVRAKTGLISRVRGLCGYLETKKGRTLTFSMHVNQYEGLWSQVDEDIDNFLSVVAERL